jgi:hypothetical protein
MQAPEAPGGIKAKLALLWTTNKPLVIAILSALILLLLGVIFLILYFTVIRPGQSR